MCANESIVFVEIFVDFNGLQSNFLEVRQPNCKGNLISLFSVIVRVKKTIF